PPAASARRSWPRLISTRPAFVPNASRPKKPTPPHPLLRNPFMLRDPDSPRLVFQPKAWLKWQFFCHAGPTEVGMFGLSDENDPLLIEDLLVVRQRTTMVSVAFDDAAVANLFDEM